MLFEKNHYVFSKLISSIFLMLIMSKKLGGHLQTMLDLWMTNGYSGLDTEACQVYSDLIGVSTDMFDTRPIGKSGRSLFCVTFTYTDHYLNCFCNKKYLSFNTGMYYGTRLRYFAILAGTTQPYGIYLGPARGELYMKEWEKFFDEQV